MVLAFLGFDRGNRILMFCMCSKLPVWQRVLTVVCPLMQNQRSTMASSDVAYVQAVPLATDGDGLGHDFTRCSSRAVT